MQIYEILCEQLAGITHPQNLANIVANSWVLFGRTAFLCKDYYRSVYAYK